MYKLNFLQKMNLQFQTFVYPSAFLYSTNYYYPAAINQQIFLKVSF